MLLQIHILIGAYVCRMLSLLLLCTDRFSPSFAENSLCHCVHGNCQMIASVKISNEN